LFAYYAGDQPIKYAAERLRDIFQNAQTRFTENWCAVVIDAIGAELLRAIEADMQAITLRHADLAVAA
jgi:hypothetical protein